MDMKMKAAAISLLLFLNGCATATRSTLLGGAIGVTAGGAIGQTGSHNSTGTVVGALIGAGIGSLIGYAAYSDKQKKEANAKPKTETGEDLTPFLTKPRVRSYIVPDAIEGNKYIKSHRVFILEDPGSWSKD
jgi:hypothetical protein